MEHLSDPFVTTTMIPCRRMQPLFWLCGCPYSPEDIPGLPDCFVRQCDVHLADEFLALKDHGDFVVQAQCTNILTDQSLIPWICPSEHTAIFGSAGELKALAQDVKENCGALSTLLDEVIQPDDASLPQVRLLCEALLLLQRAPSAVDNVQETVLQMRDQAMREYLGFWWYFSVWKKSEAPAIKAELERLVQRMQRSSGGDGSKVECSSNTESSDSGYESNSSVAADGVRPWLTVATDPIILKDDPLTVLDAFDRTNDYPPSWSTYDGNNASVLIARSMRRLFLYVESIFKNCIDHPEELENAATIRNVELPDLALLLREQAILDECLDDKTRKHLQNISDTHLELLSESAAAARKEAANKMLKKAVRAWQLRYARYRSKTLVVPMSHSGDTSLVLQIVPDSITDFIHGDEPVVIRVVDPGVGVSW